MRTLQRTGVVTLTLLLAGCGQRGALYLPDRQSNVVVNPTQDSAVPQASPVPQAAPVPQASPVPPAEPTDTDPPRRSNGTQRN